MQSARPCLYGVLFLALLSPGHAEDREYETIQAALRSLTPESVVELTKAAEAGEPRAQVILGLAYGKGAAVPQDDARSFHWLRKAADQNYAPGQNALGVLYQLGRGTPPDLAQAVDWYRKAGQQNYGPAFFNLGLMYLEGYGVPGSVVDAYAWFTLAAEAGESSARDALARNDHGIIAGERYLRLAQMYAKGEGLPQDLAASLQWTRRAADEKWTPAFFAMAHLYLHGRGVERDFAQALHWCQVLQRGRVWGSGTCMGHVLSHPENPRRNSRQALKAYRQEAESRHAVAAFRLATMLLEGDGTQKDPIEAYRWFVVCAAAGDQRCSSALAALKDQLTSTQLQEAQRKAKSWFKKKGWKVN